VGHLPEFLKTMAQGGAPRGIVRKPFDRSETMGDHGVKEVRLAGEMIIDTHCLAVQIIRQFAKTEAIEPLSLNKLKRL
jgi:hypothetical protein